MPPVLDLVDAAALDVAALVVALSPAADGAALDRRDRAEAQRFGADLAALDAVLAREKPKGQPGDVLAVPVVGKLLLAAGVGDGGPRDLRRAGATVVRRLKAVESATVTLARGSNAAGLRALAEGLLLGG